MSKKIMVVANSDWLLAHFRLPLLRALQQEGLEIFLVCPEGSYVESLQSEGFQWLPWDMKRKSISPLPVFKALWELLCYYRQYDPLLVHHITIQPIFYGSIAARLARVPVVLNNFTGLGFLFSDARSAAWLRLVTLPLMRWAMGRENYFTVVLNQQDRKELLTGDLITEDRSWIIPGDGVDLARFQPAPADQKDHDEIIVLMAARLLWDKGVEEYVRAAEILRDRNGSVHFWVAGAPDPGNPTSIPDSVIEEWGEQGDVNFLGYRTDMVSLLQQADIAVLPSYHEGVPVFLMEAAAVGLPLIATDLEGCRMVIEDGVNGYLIAREDVSALVDALTGLIRDPDLRAEMGQHSREIAKQNFDQGHIVEQFLTLYRKLGVLRDGT